MVLWQTREAILLICQLLVVTGRGAAATESFATTSGFEGFGNFGGFRGFHQFHGWLSNALDDNTGSQSQGFPAGYTEPDTNDDPFSQILPGQQEEPDLTIYQATPKTRIKIPEIHVKTKKLKTKPTEKSDNEVPDYYVGKTYNVHEPITSEEQPKDYKYSIPVKQSTSAIEEEEEADHTGPIYDGVYESMKLHQKQSKPPEPSTTEQIPTGYPHFIGAVYDVYETLPQQQIKPPKQRKNKKQKHVAAEISPTKEEADKYRLVKPVQKQKTPVKFTAPLVKNINQANPVYQVGNTGGFQPILYLPQEQLEAAIFDTAKQQAIVRGQNNVIYVYPNPYQQTLAAIDPAFRRVVKLQEPIEHHKKYLSYKSTLSTKVI